MPTPFIDNSDFTHQLKSITSKYWPAALAATVAAGGLGGLLTSNSKPINETPRQRRRRILRAILLPALSTAGGAAALGLGAAAYNMKNLRNSDPDFAQKIEKAQEKIDQQTSDRNRLAGTVAFALGSSAVTPVVKKLVKAKAPETVEVIKDTANYLKDNLSNLGKGIGVAVIKSKPKNKGLKAVAQLFGRAIGGKSKFLNNTAKVVGESSMAILPHAGIGYALDSKLHSLYDNAFGTDVNSLPTEAIEKLVK